MDGDAYAAAREALLAMPPPEPQGKPAPDAAPPVETPDPNAPANETPEPPADTDAPTPDDAAPERIRLGGLPEKDRALTAAAVLAAKAQGISVAEAMARLTGAPATPATPTPAEPAAPVVPLDGPEVVEARIAQLEADYDAAAEAADTVAMAKAHKEIRAAERDMAQSVAARETAVQASVSKAHELYPDFADRSSALAQKWDEVYSRLQANNDPLVSGSNPNIPLIIAQMSAAELGIAPRSKAAKAAAAPAKTSPPVTPPVPSPNAAVRPVQPAPGSSRTAAPSNQTGQLEAQVAGIKSLDDYEKLVSELSLAR